MAIERKDQTANNLGYPDTAYGVVKAEALGYKGSAMGTGSGQLDEYKAEYVYDLADLPSSFTSESDAGLTTLPASAVPVKVELQVLETLSGGTTLDVGLSQPDGTEIDANGLVAGYTGTAVGDYAEGAGAVIGTDIANEGQVTLTTDRTAGKIKVTVKYLTLSA